MRKIFIGISLILIAGFFTACTDAQRGKFFAIGDSAKVTCYSGGEKIYDGFSTGKVKSEENSDGYYFVDKKSKKTMEVSGNCIIIYDFEG